VPFISYLYNKIHNNERELMTLSEIRDTLFPKLFSGEIRVKDVKKFVEAIK